MNTKDIGNQGENLAVEYLQKKGYKILNTRWQWLHKEIDIIAEKAPFVVFVEVKTRQSNAFGEPYSFVSLQKRRFISQAANQYVLQNNIDAEARFDIISILYNAQSYKLEHIEDAFYALI